MSKLFSRIRGLAGKHPAAFVTIALGSVAALAVALIWFQPQTLFFDRVVDEELPPVSPTTSSVPQAEEPGTGTGEPGDLPDPEDPGPTGPAELLSGEFGSRSRYTVTGTATVFRLEDGSRVLRLEDFSSTNGPDLYVYLTVADAADSDTELNLDFVDLGLLTGNIGNQNYQIPEDVDLDRYDTVVIWCRRFTVGFGAADLIEVG